MHLYWPGVILNPLIVGGGIWFVLVFPFIARSIARRRLRMRKGRCPTCAYDLRGDLDAGCPECGWNRAEDEE